LLTLGRVLALVLGVQLSGVAHVAADVVSVVVSGRDEHAEHCPADGPCNDCPQGCPNCHCQNGVRAVAPQLTAPVVLTLPTVALATLETNAQVPLGPVLPSLFRPPRTGLTVS
jgi:hypothetical protein